MKRLGYLVFTLALIASACSGTAEPGGDEKELAALEGVDAGTDEGAGASTEDKKKGRGTESTEESGSAASGSGTNRSSSSSGAASTATGSKAGSGSSSANPAGPIPRGTHTYATDGSTTVSGNRRAMPETTTLTAEVPRGVEQTQIRDLRDSDGNGTVVETRLQYREEGVFITYVKITATFPGGLTDVRELKPRRPELIAPTGARPGSSASFSMEGSGTRADVNIKALRFEKITIGGSTVNALVVDSKIVFSGALEGEQNSTSWFWGEHIMALREQVHTDVRNGPIRVQNDYEAQLDELP
ncbi:MAG: hypothetical protein ACRDJI_00350 [Actinomycetota bacterium]